MKLELKDFDSVNFHDAKLLVAEERLEYVRLEMAFACRWGNMIAPRG